MQGKWHHLKFSKVLSEFPASCSHLDIACKLGTFIGNLPATITSTEVAIAANQIDYAKYNYT